MNVKQGAELRVWGESGGNQAAEIPNQILQGCFPKIFVFRKQSKGEGGCIFGPGSGADPGVLRGV